MSSAPVKTDKLDLYKLHKAEYVTPKKPTLVTTTRAKYLAVTGQGAPGGDEFQAKVGALYGMAFTIKMTRKFEGKGDYVVSKLEGQYWTEGDVPFSQELPPDAWQWRLMIRTPDFVSPRDLSEARTKLTERGKGTGTDDVELISLSEGTCVQMLHVGPYDQEGTTVDQMRSFAETEGYRVCGRHHDIYLSDPRRVSPEKLRTILRLPVEKQK